MALKYQANTAPGMKTSFQLDVGTRVMRSEVENTLPSPEVKTTRKGRDRGRGTTKEEDTMTGHEPMTQVTSRTENNNGCVVTDALMTISPEKTKQKDNKEVNQMEISELAQNKRVDERGADMSANENTGEGERLESKQEWIPESPSEDKDDNLGDGRGCTCSIGVGIKPTHVTTNKSVSKNPQIQPAESGYPTQDCHSESTEFAIPEVFPVGSEGNCQDSCQRPAAGPLAQETVQIDNEDSNSKDTESGAEGECAY